MCRKFTLIFTTNFVGSLDIRASREVFAIEVRSPEISQSIYAKKGVGVHALARHVMELSDVQLYLMLQKSGGFRTQASRVKM